MHYRKANGKSSPRVFALKGAEPGKGESIALTKKLPFKAMTTRALYPGEHRLEVVVNGVASASHRFELIP